MEFDIKIGETTLKSNEAGLIRKVVVMSDSIDNNLRDRAAGVLCRVEIAFAIKAETKELAKDLLDWSFKTRDSLYRDVSITIMSSDGKNGVDQIRKIEIPTMFCEDCYESYELGQESMNEGISEGLFTIKMIQRSGNFSSIQNGN